MNKEIIKYNLPQVSLHASSVTFLPGTCLRGTHYHSEIELVCVHSGKLICHIEDLTFTLLPYDTLLINKNIVHSIECFDFETKFSYIQIETDRHFVATKNFYSDFLHKFIDKTSPKHFFVDNKKSELYDIFNNTIYEFNSSEDFSSLYLQSYILQLIAFMYRHKLVNEFDSSFLAELERIKPAIHFMESHFKDKVYIDEIAAIINLNKFQLCKYFKSLTGGTVIDYMNFIRLEHATNLILKTNKTITEIAYLCGFSSTQYFNKVFKKNFGCSPKKFKYIF